MKRDVTVLFNFFLDQLLPPMLRDARWLSNLLMRSVLGPRAQMFTDFKDKVNDMSDAELAEYYVMTENIMKRETDLHSKSIDRILREVTEGPVLEVGCGRGYLAGILAKHFPVSGVDLVVPDSVRRKYPEVQFLQGDAEALPLPDRSFPTVVCTHTLEHVRALPVAIDELRRVCSDKLIIVVPKQRPYRYTFDLHIHFFPYEHSLINALRPLPRSYGCETVGGDLFYIERMPRGSSRIKSENGGTIIPR